VRCCRRWIELGASRGKPLAAVSLRTSFPLTLKRSRKPCIHAGFSGGGWVDGVRVCVFVSGRPSGRPGLLPAAALRPGWRGTRPEEAIAGGRGNPAVLFLGFGPGAPRCSQLCCRWSGRDRKPPIPLFGRPGSDGSTDAEARLARNPKTQRGRVDPPPEAWPTTGAGPGSLAALPFPLAWLLLLLLLLLLFLAGVWGRPEAPMYAFPARPARPPLLLMENHNCPLGRAHRSEAPNPPQQKAGALGGGTKWSRLRPAPAKTGPALQRGPVFVRPRMLIAGARVQRPGREGSTAAATAASCRTRATALSWRAACRERSRPATPCPGRRCG
jgi:hypothetical protein